MKKARVMTHLSPLYQAAPPPPNQPLNMISSECNGDLVNRKNNFLDQSKGEVVYSIKTYFCVRIWHLIFEAVLVGAKQEHTCLLTSAGGGGVEESCRF